MVCLEYSFVVKSHNLLIPDFKTFSKQMAVREEFKIDEGSKGTDRRRNFVGGKYVTLGK